MLVQFSFSNYKCFKDVTTLNLVASNVKGVEHYAHKVLPKMSILKSAVVYGANASGKTKLFEAFRFMRTFICPPKRDGKVPMLDFWKSRYDTFRLNTQSKDEMSFFEAIFVIEGIQYRYGFELNGGRVNAEWLYLKKQKEVPVFVKEDEKVTKLNKEHLNVKIANNIIAANMLSSTSCFLAVLATFNEPLSTKIVSWFEEIPVISANDIRSVNALTDDENRKSILAFLKAFDFNIEDLKLHEISVDEIPEKIRAIIGEDGIHGSIYDGINTQHKIYNNQYERDGNIWFSLEKDESFGTNRLFNLSVPIIFSLMNGTPIFIDEFDSGIHPNIIQNIVKLFYQCKTSAQLIINTQNTSMLSAIDNNDKKLFRKDQVFFVEKNRYGESSLIPMTDFNGDFRSNLEKIYLNGEVGSVPFIEIQKVLDLINRE